MPRRYEKQAPPAPTERAVLLRRQPRPMEIVRWMERELVVSEGDLAGQGFAVRPFQRKFIRGFMRSTESALTMGRGNGKTTLCAALAAACIDGPLMIQRGQVAVIAATLDQGSILFRHLLWLLGDRLNDVMTWRVVDNSQIMKIERRDTGAHVRVYGSNPASAHGLAPQIALLDEPAKWRESWSAKMYAAVVTGLGKQPHSRLIALGTKPERGTGHWFSEMIDGGPQAGVYVQQHWAPDDDDDRWPVFGMRSIRAANPMLDHNESLRSEIMRHRDKARLRGGDSMAQWNSLRLNRGTPEVAGRSRIVSLSAWSACVTEEPPLAEGPVCIGVDLGGSSSMTAAAMYWPETGLLRCVGAFPSDPPLGERGADDGVGERYVKMHRRGEIAVFPGRVTPVAAFLMQIFRLLDGQRVIKIVADRYRKAEAEQAFAEAGIHLVEVEHERDAETVADEGWPVFWRPVGAGPDGAMDVRGFQGEVLESHLGMAPCLMMESAVAESVIGYKDGNPRLEKARQTSRIDALQAAVLAVGAGRRWRKPQQDERLQPFRVEDYVAMPA